MTALHIRLLGGFEAWLGSGVVLALKGRKTQALVAYLALAPGKQRTRDELIGLLWGGKVTGSNHVGRASYFNKLLETRRQAEKP